MRVEERGIWKDVLGGKVGNMLGILESLGFGVEVG